MSLVSAAATPLVPGSIPAPLQVPPSPLCPPGTPGTCDSPKSRSSPRTSGLFLKEPHLILFTHRAQWEPPFEPRRDVGARGLTEPCFSFSHLLWVPPKCPDPGGSVRPCPEGRHLGAERLPLQLPPKLPSAPASSPAGIRRLDGVARLGFARGCAGPVAGAGCAPCSPPEDRKSWVSLCPDRVSTISHRSMHGFLQVTLAKHIKKSDLGREEFWR